MAWRLHRSAIAACLIYFREIDPTAFWEFCNTIPRQADMVRLIAYVQKVPILLKKSFLADEQSQDR
jgi:hypothetical protein